MCVEKTVTMDEIARFDGLNFFLTYLEWTQLNVKYGLIGLCEF